MVEAQDAMEAELDHAADQMAVKDDQIVALQHTLHELKQGTLTTSTEGESPKPQTLNPKP